MPSKRPTSERNHYEVLQLPYNGDSSNLSKEAVKSAYRRTLLQFHPDKAHGSAIGSSSEGVPNNQKQDRSSLSIDEILLAYEVLSDPVKRTAYDDSLKQRNGKIWHQPDSGRGQHLGVEIYDLEDMKYTENEQDQGQWSISCRCGNEEGYVVTEDELEEASRDGEIFVPCRGCSLYIKVLFSTEEPNNNG